MAGSRGRSPSVKRRLHSPDAASVPVGADEVSRLEAEIRTFMARVTDEFVRVQLAQTELEERINVARVSNRVTHLEITPTIWTGG